MEFIKTYFNAEKSESLIFMAIGIVTISFSVYTLIRWSEPFHKGIALPLVAIGLIQIVVGGSVYFRTDHQVRELESLYQREVQAYQSKEIPRMENVMKNFSAYKKVEIAFVVVGLVLLIFCSSKEFWLGLGVGMLLQGSLMLTADIFAERRGVVYIDQVRNL